jgi:CPA2 family monovalent cation:H+ antiporter-2
MRLLEDRGELGSNHGRVAMGYLVIQDLSLILFVACLPLLAGKGSANVPIDLLRPIAILAIGVFIALRAAPLILDRIARLGSRELFVLAVVTLCLGAGFLADIAGLGVALGAFFAGLVVSESSYAQEIFSQVRPLRDVFASVFFVSVGMMLDPGFVVQNLGAVVGLIAVILLLKPLTVMVPLRSLGWQGRTIVLSGLYLANVGEFSFVLAMLGQQAGVIDREIGSLIVAAALVTLALAPFAMQKAGAIYYRMNQIGPVARWLHRSRHDPLPAEMPGQTFRAIVLGGGRVGRYVSEALTYNQIPHVVVDLDVHCLERLRSPYMHPSYGDATSAVVLRKVHPKNAELAVLTLPDADSTGIALRELKRLSPKLFVVARVHRGEDIPELRTLGADAVIHGEFEAGVETIRQTLRKLGIGRDEVRAYLDRARAHRYREECEI